MKRLATSVNAILGDDTEITMSDWVSTVTGEQSVCCRLDYDVSIIGKPEKLEQIAKAILSHLQQLQEEEMING